MKTLPIAIAMISLSACAELQQARTDINAFGEQIGYDEQAAEAYANHQYAIHNGQDAAYARAIQERINAGDTDPALAAELQNLRLQSQMKEQSRLLNQIQQDMHCMKTGQFCY